MRRYAATPTGNRLTVSFMDEQGGMDALLAFFQGVLDGGTYSVKTASYCISLTPGTPLEEVKWLRNCCRAKVAVKYLFTAIRRARYGLTLKQSVRWLRKEERRRERRLERKLFIAADTGNAAMLNLRVGE